MYDFAKMIGSIQDKSLKYIRKLNKSTIDFIQDRPYMARTNTYSLSEDAGILRAVEINDKFCEIARFFPQNTNFANSLDFINIESRKQRH